MLSNRVTAGLAAVCLLALAACGGASTAVRQWSVALPHVQDLQVVSNQIAVRHGSDLLISGLAAWKPQQQVLQPGENCVLSGDAKGDLVCLVPAQGGTSVLLQPLHGVGLSMADLVQPAQAMVVKADPNFLVVQVTLADGSQQTFALDLANQAVATLSVPPNRAVGLLGSSYLAEVSGLSGNASLVAVTLPTGTAHTVAELPAPLLDPMLSAGWIFGFPLTAQPSAPRFDAYSASGGQLAHLALPSGLLLDAPYAVGPGYALVDLHGTYSVFLAQSQTMVSLSLKAQANALLGTNGQNVAYVLIGKTLHLAQVPLQTP
ncbi:MAG: hypothetical protein ACYCO4_03680 [Sulfobacillus sp.]